MQVFNTVVMLRFGAYHQLKVPTKQWTEEF